MTIKGTDCKVFRHQSTCLVGAILIHYVILSATIANCISVPSKSVPSSPSSSSSEKKEVPQNGVLVSFLGHRVAEIWSNTSTLTTHRSNPNRMSGPFDYLHDRKHVFMSKTILKGNTLARHLTVRHRDGRESLICLTKKQAIKLRPMTWKNRRGPHCIWLIQVHRDKRSRKIKRIHMRRRLRMKQLRRLRNDKNRLRRSSHSLRHGLSNKLFRLKSTNTDPVYLAIAEVKLIVSTTEDLTTLFSVRQLLKPL